MARYPNFDPEQPIFNGYAADCLDPERVKHWADPRGGFVHAQHIARWGGMHYVIVDKKDDGTVTLDGGWQNNRPANMHPLYPLCGKHLRGTRRSRRMVSRRQKPYALLLSARRREFGSGEDRVRSPAPPRRVSGHAEASRAIHHAEGADVPPRRADTSWTPRNGSCAAIGRFVATGPCCSAAPKTVRWTTASSTSGRDRGFREQLQPRHHDSRLPYRGGRRERRGVCRRSATRPASPATGTIAPNAWPRWTGRPAPRPTIFPPIAWWTTA